MHPVLVVRVPWCRCTGTRTAQALCLRHPSTGPLRGEHLQYSEFGETAELGYRLRQPPFLIPNSSVLRARHSDWVTQA
jgi:hypothetical protein